MLLLLDNTFTAPDYNLAAEEYLLTQFREPIFRLWRNGPSIIVGRHQNTWAEVNIDYVREHQIPVIRRLSGGGAVFHDLGNINYSFMESVQTEEDTSGTFQRCTQPILEALRAFGVEAYLSGRNDLLIDGKKFSGTAQCRVQGRVLLHGTLLYASQLSNLGQALQGPRSKFSKKAVASQPSPVCNVSQHLVQPPAVEAFMQQLFDYFRMHNEGLEIYEYSEADLQNIRNLRDQKYGTEAWNWGENPQYLHQEEIATPAGKLQLHYDTNPEGRICRAVIYADHIGNLDAEALAQKLLEILPSEIAAQYTF
jgi:lipoyltransferase and lipoate-protein ligase